LPAGYGKSSGERHDGQTKTKHCCDAIAHVNPPEFALAPFRRLRAFMTIRS
jgi:hypothetical protein